MIILVGIIVICAGLLALYASADGGSGSSGGWWDE